MKGRENKPLSQRVQLHGQKKTTYAFNLLERSLESSASIVHRDGGHAESSCGLGYQLLNGLHGGEERHGMGLDSLVYVDEDIRLVLEDEVTAGASQRAVVLLGAEELEDTNRLAVVGLP